MWFPPYDLSFDESVNANWQDNTFLGRTEPIYTYTNTSRKGNLNFKVIVDHPSIMNVLVNKELENESSSETINQVIDSFFAGCTKYDLYDLVKKFPMFTPNDVYEVQLLNTPEDVKTVTDELPSTDVVQQSVTTNTPNTTTEESPPCTEFQVNVGVATDISYIDCSGTTITLTGLTPTTTTIICVKSTTTPMFTVTNSANTVTNTLKPCTTPTVTTTPPETTEKPIEDQFPEVGFYFHNDFPDPNDNRITASNDYNFWLTKYKALKTKYLTTGGSDGTRDFGKARNKIIKYDDAGYVDYTNFVFSGSNELQIKYLDSYVDTRIVKVDEFFTFIDSEFAEAQRFIKKISEGLDAGETVSFDILGSASSITDDAYNINLSKRRIDSVMQWIFKQVTPKGKKLVDFTTGTKPKLIIKTIATGEGGPLIEPTYAAINCSKNYKSNSNEGTVSVNAMACRRARIIKTFMSNNNTASQKPPATTPTTPTNDNGTTTAMDDLPPPSSGVETKPVNTVKETPGFVSQAQTGKTETDITPPSASSTKTPAGKVAPKRRADLTKRLARKLLTECNYFEMIKREDPMIYDGIKSKIKHFHPVFHSITPEGLNARLTFLQQCMRPGDTIPTVSMDGNNTKLIYNDVTNSAFGAPPICVLRIGDFFHTKIVISSLSIKYEDGRFDLNPEGIGIQPMIADVSIGFDFIGGHGLAGPVASLQNALSFNYYANTEMYDERAEKSIDDEASKYDAELFESIKNQVGVIENDDNRENTTNGGVPIGVPITTNLDANNLNLVSGTITYTDIMKKLVDSTKASLKTTIDTLEKINSEFLLGGLQIFTKDRKYIDGYIGVGTTDNVKIFGKSSKTQEKVENLVKLANKDVDDNTCPLLDGLELEDLSNPQKRKIKKYIQTLIDNKSALLIGELNNYSTQISNEELKLISIIDKINYVSNAHDGYITNQGKVIVYNISGTTQITPPNKETVTNTLQELLADSEEIKNDIGKFYNELTNNIIPSGNTEYNDSFTFDSYFNDSNTNGVPSYNRFFMLFGKEIIDDPTKFVQGCVDNGIPTANDEDKKKWVDFLSKNVNEELVKNYKNSKTETEKHFKKFKDDYFNNIFNTYKTTFTSKKRIMTYVIILTSTSPYDEDLKRLYSNSNSSGDKFNLKKTFT